VSKKRDERVEKKRRNQETRKPGNQLGGPRTPKKMGEFSSVLQTT